MIIIVTYPFLYFKLEYNRKMSCETQGGGSLLPSRKSWSIWKKGWVEYSPRKVRVKSKTGIIHHVIVHTRIGQQDISFIKLMIFRSTWKP